MAVSYIWIHLTQIFRWNLAPKSATTETFVVVDSVIVAPPVGVFHVRSRRNAKKLRRWSKAAPERLRVSLRNREDLLGNVHWPPIVPGFPGSYRPNLRFVPSHNLCMEVLVIGPCSIASFPGYLGRVDTQQLFVLSCDVLVLYCRRPKYRTKGTRHT
jgi:hypothetical protein